MKLDRLEKVLAVVCYTIFIAAGLQTAAQLILGKIEEKREAAKGDAAKEMETRKRLLELEGTVAALEAYIKKNN